MAHDRTRNHEAECDAQEPHSKPRDEYYILSMKWTGQGMYSDLVTFWRPNNSGYTVYLSAAGRYKESELRGDIKRLPVTWPWSETTRDSVAVPCTLVDAMAQSFLPNEGEVLAALSKGEVAERYANNARAMQPEREAAAKLRESHGRLVEALRWLMFTCEEPGVDFPMARVALKAAEEVEGI